MAISPLRTFNPGIYKLFLKSDARTCSVLPVFQRVAQRPRLVIQPILVQTHPEGIEFVDNERVRVCVWAGRMQGECLCPAKELFDRFVLRLAIAKQQREKITVNIH